VPAGDEEEPVPAVDAGLRVLGGEELDGGDRDVPLSA
jgi:hypothetical protein